MKIIGWSVLVLVFGNLSAFAEFDWKKAQRQYEENVRIAARYPFREFENAAESGDLATVKRLLDQGVPADLPLPWPEESFEGIPPSERAIHHAASGGHIEVVRLLLDRGADANGHAGEGNYTPLHATDDIEIAKLLISRGANVNARDNMGSQPIHYNSCSSDLTKLLIAHGADPLAKDDHEYQPIHGAARSGNPKDVAFFLGLKAKVDAKIHDKEGHDSWNGWQPLHFAANREDMDEALKVAELLIRKGAVVNAISTQGETPLYLSKNAVMTRLLLQHGAKPDVMTTGIIQQQPIHRFAMQGDVESIKLLLDRGVDIEARSADEDEQTTALDTAAFWGKKDTVEFLLKRGAKPTERTMKNARRFDTNPIEIVILLHDHGGIVSAEMFLLFPKDSKTLLPLLDQKAKDDLIKQSAEHIADAAEAGDLGIIQDLVALGAKTDQPWQNLLPIHRAAASGKEEVVEYFLSAGQAIDAKCNVRDEDMTPPMDFTDLQPIHCSFVKPELIPFLIKKGAKIDATTGEGWQPVHFAAAFGDAAMLKAVIDAGGNPKAKTLNGKTPLQLAEEFKQEGSVKFLQSLK